MNTTHTPGPWTYKDDFELVVVPKNDPQADAICEITGNPSEQFANARLIAAAPELLEALQNLVQFVEWREDFIVEDHEEGEENQYSKALTVIQKATKP
jgi:hypothetical protein